MKQKLIIVLLIMTGLTRAQMQTIRGIFPRLKCVEVTLMGYEGFQEKELTKTVCDSSGHAELSYPAGYTGAALLKVGGLGSAILLLNNENFEIEWTDVKDVNSLTFRHSPENDAFTEGFMLNSDAEQKLAGLRYLLPKFEKEPGKYSWLNDEIAMQEKRFGVFVGELPPASYAAYYLRLRKLLTDMSQTAPKDGGKIAQSEAGFKSLDVANSRLWHSGMMDKLYTGIYQLITGNSDTANVNERINGISDAWIKGLSSNPARQQEVAEYCFKMLEQQNRTSASEHIALSMLNQSDCQPDEQRTILFEQYRRMGIGSTAPDIVLQNGKKLSTVDHNYRLMVFGASWCPNCQRDYPSLVGSYKRIKASYDVEFVYVSLDIDKKAFESFFKEAPFIVSYDGKGWKSDAVKAFYVMATPSYFLLNRDLKIIAKPKVPEEVMECIKKLETH